MVDVTPTTLVTGGLALVQSGYLLKAYLARQVNLGEIEKHHKAQMTNRALSQDVNDTE